MGIGIIGGGGGAVTSDDLTATAANVLIGLTYMGSDTDNDQGVGTMPNNNAVSHTLNAGASYQIPAGYHNGSGVVSARALSLETPGNAAPGQILYGYTATVAGVKRTGTMPNNGAQTQTLDAGGSYQIPAGYHNGSGVVTAKSLASQTAGTAAAGQILVNYNAWVGGQNLAGTMPNRGAVSETIGPGETYPIPAGYHNGSGVVSVTTLAAETSATATANRIRAPYTAWVDGERITGTGTSTAGQVITPGTSNIVIGGGTFLTGSITVKGSAYLAPQYIKSGITIFGVTGEWEGLT